MGSRIQKLRESRGWSRRQLATAAELSDATVGRIERGEVQKPGGQTLLKLATALDAPLDTILPGPNRTHDRAIEKLRRHPELHAWFAGEATEEDLEVIEAYSRGKRRRPPGEEG